jgi:probable HAF family extracellular repeat protein
MTDLGTLGGGPDEQSQALAINDFGYITGWSHDGGQAPPFLYDGTEIRALSGIPHGRGYGINSLGQVVGEMQLPLPQGSYFRGFLWQAGIVTDLGTLSGNVVGLSSVARAINSRGDIVGCSQVIGNPACFAFYLDQQGMQQIGPAGSQATDINDAGQVVGTSWAGAFLWESGGITYLGFLPGGGSSDAWAINRQGQVVGQATIGHSSFAVLWEKGAIYNLESLIPASSGWRLWWASDINDRGQIVGYGYHHGQQRGFLLTPVPEPGSALVVLFVLALWGGVRACRLVRAPQAQRKA